MLLGLLGDTLRQYAKKTPAFALALDVLVVALLALTGLQVAYAVFVESFPNVHSCLAGFFSTLSMAALIYGLKVRILADSAIGNARAVAEFLVPATVLLGTTFHFFR